MENKIKSFRELGEALNKLFKGESVMMFYKHKHKKSTSYQICSRPNNDDLEFNINFEVVKKGCKNTDTKRFFVFKLEMKKITIDFEWVGYEIKKDSKDPQEIFDIIKEIKDNNKR